MLVPKKRPKNCLQDGNGVFTTQVRPRHQLFAPRVGLPQLADTGPHSASAYLTLELLRGSGSQSPIG